ncbi:helix-turn-helix transcriptional regulator [Geomicrobium sp. JCM 19039]|uniref:helix-turn-helix domain-containing protein n=1 Tax=Geomicrobium sp. JCM 19039 TaxID=1460636 RepID=UPI00045F2C66|nr:helix-turn-helix transcriptional regulator [Geomicrobium sp. JCM 19039]GAK11363.1 hypothetical protein JCM19039_1053 [Geomicrobium sp. JCM 19039]
MMKNANSHRLYRASRIKDILRIARERASQPEQRTKQWLSRELGISYRALTAIEEGDAPPTLELAISWCEALEDRIAKEKILYIYGIQALPPTDPRLLADMSTQLINFLQELAEAGAAAKELQRISVSKRPGKEFNPLELEEIQRLLKQILDVRHASYCIANVAEEAWGVARESVKHQWVQQSVANDVVIKSIDEYEKYMKDRNYEQHIQHIVQQNGAL